MADVPSESNELVNIQPANSPLTLNDILIKFGSRLDKLKHLSVEERKFIFDLVRFLFESFGEECFSDGFV
jgi:hypothetical protein